MHFHLGFSCRPSIDIHKQIWAVTVSCPVLIKLHRKLSFISAEVWDVWPPSVSDVCATCDERDFPGHAEWATSLCGFTARRNLLWSTWKSPDLPCCLDSVRALYPIDRVLTRGSWLPAPLLNYQGLTWWPGVWTGMLEYALLYVANGEAWRPR